MEPYCIWISKAQPSGQLQVHGIEPGIAGLGDQGGVGIQHALNLGKEPPGVDADLSIHRGFGNRFGADAVEGRQRGWIGPDLASQGGQELVEPDPIVGGPGQPHEIRTGKNELGLADFNGVSTRGIV